MRFTLGHIAFAFVLFTFNWLCNCNFSRAQVDVQSGDNIAATTAQQRLNSWEQHVAMKEASPFKQIQWKRLGPRKQGGRIEAIACPPGVSSTMYVGVGSGGVWKTDNNGITWRPIFEDQATNAIGDIAVAVSDPNVVWVATGEVLMTPRSSEPGLGVFRSTDAGQTWTHVGLADTHHIGKIRVADDDANVAYVAAIGHLSTKNEERGVFKTNDGGQTWEKVLYLGDETGAIDLVLDPRDSNVVYATTWKRALIGAEHYGRTSGIHKSVDGGKTWQRLSNGLPDGPEVGRIAIDIARSSPDMIYALVDHKSGDALYRSQDAGNSWNKVNQQPVRASWDWCEIQVSPDDKEEIYSIGQTSYVSNDGGKTFREIAGKIVRLQPHLSRVLHLDTHSMWIDPMNTDHVVFGNDGGLFVSYDRAQNWLHLNNLPIAEVYATTYDLEEPYNVYIGTQDNAALFGPSDHDPADGTNDEWTQIYIDRWGGGDSYFTYRDEEDDDLFYYESQYGGMRRLRMSTGKSVSIRPQDLPSEARLRFAWMTPFFPSKHKPGRFYVGANRVFRSENKGDSWQAISGDLTKEGPDSPGLLYRAITAMAESPLQSGLLVAGTDNGNICLTLDDGDSWQKIDSDLPDLDVTRVTFSNYDSKTIYVTLSGMRYDDFTPYVFRSDDRGETWQSISKGLPLEPVNVIREHPRHEGVLLVGTDLGVYMSINGGQSWDSLRANLPTVAIHDLFVHPREGELVVGTHGLSVFKAELSILNTALSEKDDRDR